MNAPENNIYTGAHLRRMAPARAALERIFDNAIYPQADDALIADGSVSIPGIPAPLTQAPEMSRRTVILPDVPGPPQSVREELKYGSFSNIPLLIGVASLRILLKPPQGTRRVYLLLVNTSPLNLIYVAFGQAASVLNGVPLMLNFGFWEFDAVVPQDDVYIIGGAAATTGVLVYSNKAIRS